MLGRLADRGAVIAEGTGRKRRYAAAERLYSIYYKLRRERDDAAIVRSLIHFMAAIYSKAELAGMTSGLRMEMAESTAIHVQEEPGDYAATIAPYDEAIVRFGDSDAPEMQARVAWALSCKGLVQTAIGRADESLRICAELDRRLATLTGDQRTLLAWRSKWLRAAALLMQGKRPAAMENFRSAYAGFAPENVAMMREITVVTIPRLIAIGASEQDLVEILSNDETKSDALTPLFIALRQRMGVEVRAPTEMLEVAEDIRKQIEKTTATGAPAAS